MTKKARESNLKGYNKFVRKLLNTCAEAVSRRASMRWSCTMTSPRDISLVEEEGADVDEAEWDGAEREEGAAESNYCDLNYTSLHFMVA